MKLISKRLVKEGKLDDIIKVFKELAAPSRKEKGCLSYELFQDQKDSDIVAIIEEWENKEALDEHKKTDHFINLVPELDKYTEKKIDLSLYNKLA
ncbi:MAG: putative quinol monooxygenase [Clostridiaceae bacterium]